MEEFIQWEIGKTSVLDPKRQELMMVWEQAHPTKAPTKSTTKTPVKSSKKTADILDDLNPTGWPWGWLHAEYSPEWRATAPLWENITTLAETMGKSPNEAIMIYRWAPSSQKNIVPWDYITTNYDLAKSYAWEGKVISKKVKLWEILDDITEPLWDEYIYRPKK